MTPYYEDESCTIYHGDAREVVAHLTFDTTVTDPPYGMGHYSTDVDALSPTLLVSLIVNGTTAIFGYPERMVGLCVAAGVVPDEWVTWWATNAAAKGFNLHGLWKETEVVAIFGAHRCSELRVERTARGSAFTTGVNYKGVKDRGGRQRSDLRRAGDVWRDASPGVAFNARHRKHPNEKPVSLMRRLIEAMPPGVVLDPFMGSGTTLVAARELGRPAVGIEVDERHCETAAKRLAQGALDLSA